MTVQHEEEFTISKSDGVRVQHEKKSDGLRVHHKKKSERVRLYH